MIDDRRKIIAEINGWIEGHIPFREKNRIKAEINRRSNEEIRKLQELINNKQDLSPDDFKQRLQELKEEQKQRQDSQISQPEKNTGEEQMSDTNAEEKLTKEDFIAKYQQKIKEELGIKVDMERAYNIYTQSKNNDWISVLTQEVNTSSKKEKDGKIPTSVDEGGSDTYASNKKSEWNGLLEQYQTAYDANPQTKNQYNINGELQDDGSYLIAIDPKEEGKTGTVAQYYDRNHFAIRTSTKGVEPKDQSFEHFKNHIAVAKENGSDEIVMGNTKSAIFRTKLAAAVLATEGMSLHMSSKGIDSLDFSPETLKGIPAETQGKLLEFSLQNDVEIENPILDFNNEAVKNLPEELKYKYLATLLKNEDAKGQIKNAPEVDLNKKDPQGQYIPNKKASTYFIATKEEMLYLQANDEGELKITEKDGQPYATVLDADGKPTERNLPLTKVGDKYTYKTPNKSDPYKVIPIVPLEKYTENDGFSTEDLKVLAQYRYEQRQQKYKALNNTPTKRENETEEEFEKRKERQEKRQKIHDKVAELRNRLKESKDKLKDKPEEEQKKARKDIISDAKVTEQEHGVNFYKYAQKHTQNTN